MTCIMKNSHYINTMQDALGVLHVFLLKKEKNNEYSY